MPARHWVAALYAAAGIRVSLVLPVDHDARLRSRVTEAAVVHMQLNLGKLHRPRHRYGVRHSTTTVGSEAATLTY